MPIAQRRTLDGVLAGERGAQQGHSFFRDLGVGVESIGKFAGVPAKEPGEMR